jgi:parallel beta-helix repeat protein
MVSVLALAGLVVFALSGHAGDLEPSGPPGPTMKTLEEVEPRTPISQDDIPLTITISGSYYLTENLFAVGFGPHVIEIADDDITIDLRGFAITGSSEVAQANDCIVVSSGDNIEIKDGVVRDGIDDGIDTFAATNSRIINIRAFNNTDRGITTGNGSTVLGCTARSNGGVGIKVGFGGLAENCTARENGSGIRADNGSAVINCAARFNSSIGISVVNNCVVTACTASENDSDGIGTGVQCTVTNNTASNNGVWGIESASSLISGNTANSNTLDGIKVSDRSLVINNNCASNGNLDDGAGIFVTGNRNRVEGNNVVLNDRGIDVDDGDNIIIGNTAGSNGANYAIVAGNSYGPIVNVAGVGDISGTLNANHPWANFQY